MRFCPVVTAVFFVAAALVSVVSAQEESSVMEILIEKAREREAAFDNVEVTFTFGRAQSGWFGTGYWAKSGERYRLVSQVTRSEDDGNTYKSESTHVRDGEIVSVLSKHDEYSRGVIVPDGGLASRSLVSMSERFGITGLPRGSGSMVEKLLGNSTEVKEAVADPFNWRANWHGEISRETHMVGTEVKDGRTLIVVDVTETREGQRHGDLHRLYFDEELDYACVRFEWGLKTEEKFHIYERWSFGDFREVEGGLLVPFSAVKEQASGEKISEYTIESLDFPDGFGEGHFEIEFPAGTHVSDRIVGFSYTAGGISAEELRLFLEELEPDLEAAVMEAAAEDEQAAVEIAVVEESAEVEEGARGWAMWLLVVALVAAGAAAAIVVRGRKGR